MTIAIHDDTVTMSRAEYQDLIDARDHALAMCAVTSGAMETLSGAELDAYLAAPTPLAYWRRRRGLTQVELARSAEITQPFVAQLEAGERDPSASVLGRIARCLRVRVDDLIGV
jgi:DNA-binding XRE family transcriptional regulator